jgi:ribosomal protein S18 acetylase RimI-like enzyme
MIIEQATNNDAKKILGLQKIAYQSEARRYNDYNLPPLLQTFDEIQIDFKEQIFLKAVVSGKIIGSVRAYMENGTCFIGRVIVDPDYQNQGIGTKLMHHIETWFSNANRFELFTGHESEEALNLYNKLGYTILKRKKLSTHTLVFLGKNKS